MSSGAPLPDAYLALGKAYVDAGRIDEAVETLLQGVRLGDTRGPSCTSRWRAPIARKGCWTRPKPQLTLGVPKRAALSASSDYPYQQVELDYQLERGMLKLQRGQLAAAAEAFKKVLELDPNHEAATRELAEVNRRLRAKKPGGGD